MNKKEAKILIVDDIEDNRYTLERSLKRDGYENISLAECGKEALDLVNKSKFDLILLDLMMPVMNGFEFLKVIRETEFSNIPILVLTGADLSEEEKKFLSGETHKILQKSDDTLSTIVNEVGQVIRASSNKGE